MRAARSPHPLVRRLALGQLATVLALGGCAGTGAHARPALAPAAPRPTPGAEATGQGGAVRVLDPYLAARLAALEARSPTLRAAMARLRAGRVELLLATAAQGARVVRHTAAAGLPAPERLLGAAITFHEPRSGRVLAVLVHVDVERAAAAARGLAALPAVASVQAALDRLVDEVLVHEVWGHAVPLALAGTVGAACPDPRPGERAEDACVTRRENVLRGELGWPRRATYAFAAPRPIAED